ncbi:unnamed protein product [Haemonchus placei]|uniref:Peptidase M12A domain-containing protein n=1 Tax=Haemonchus placei TaxID=6290 RepID=A0A0N4X2L6_HAEPC|nr:unnamed protein product [Haemonchus placei]
MYDAFLMSRFLQMPLPPTYDDRLWITKILDHMSYEEAFRRRHEIPFRPYKKDRSANIHNNWVYKVIAHRSEVYSIFTACIRLKVHPYDH